MPMGHGKNLAILPAIRASDAGYLEVELVVDVAMDELAEVLLGSDHHGAGQQQRRPQPEHSRKEQATRDDLQKLTCSTSRR